MPAFNRRNQILMVPFVGMEMEQAKFVASSWTDFERLLTL
jgi:hypothetical protein